VSLLRTPAIGVSCSLAFVARDQLGAAGKIDVPALTYGSAITMSNSLQRDGYSLISALFLRLLALIYLAAFISTGLQIIGIAGEQGILPVAEKIESLRVAHGWSGFWKFPTLFWIDASDDALFAVALAGCVFSVALFLNVLPRLSVALLFVLYLSLFHAGQLFMNFQWDYLLLESGFLAIFLAAGAPRWAVWMFRWLLFRVRFLSGVSKLISQDPSWANLTALTYFFEVQPLPHWGGWYAHQLPEGLLRVATASALFIEIIVPFMILMPRKIRLIGAWLTILMQVIILLTSNHNYANFLVLALCLFLFEDRDIRRVLPGNMERWLSGSLNVAARNLFAKSVAAVVAGVIVTVSLIQMWGMFSGWRGPQVMQTVLQSLHPFHIVNRYHVFATMKTERIEFIVEGSVDGVNWQAYEFKYKPGDMYRRPQVVVPHHPRLDWLMWFVPTHPAFLPWFEKFLLRLAENSPAVVDLLAHNPFPEQGPRQLRVSVYRYRFSDPDTRAATGQWWQREYLGFFFPLAELRN
jgi:hypothetical protein